MQADHNHGVDFQLRHTEESDLPVIMGWVPTQADMVLWSGTTFQWPLNLDQLVRDLDESAVAGRILWTATVNEGLPIGCASVIISEDGAIGRFGRLLLNPVKRGAGYGRPLVFRTVDAAFSETGIDLLTLGVHDHNRAARELYLGLGFQETGIVFDSVVDGRAWRRIEMACTRADFRADSVGADSQVPAAG